MTPPRLVATDLDGTLLRTGAFLSPRTRNALRLAREAGAEVVFVTARPPRSVDAIAEAAGVSGTAICSNGAIVYDLAGRSVLRTHALEPATARTVAETLSEALPGVAFAVETGSGVLFEPEYQARALPDGRAVPSPWEAGEPIVKVLAWSAARHADEMFTAAVAALDGTAEVTHSGGRGLLEISATGVTKAGTLAGLCAERGVDPADVVAFGDMPNDLAVLAFAGTGYAMANAHHLVLAAVERTTLSNDEDGVAAVLEQLYASGLPQRE
ncbi:HAD-IIB family hydrolase [Nonomuraea sp. NPDC046570]|uniref:HAD family hydrolase n=1 Tax=Nonomuraea sp. NPDC046570 TaxID=3155255 RepID=UPI0033F30E7E